MNGICPNDYFGYAHLVIAGIAVDLPEHHSDPQDRIIIATALSHDAQLMSADGKFPLYKELADRLL